METPEKDLEPHFRFLSERLKEIYEGYSSYVFTTTATILLVIGWLLTSKDARSYLAGYPAVTWVMTVAIIVTKVFRPHKDTLLHDLIRNLNMSDLDYSTGHWAEESVAEYIALLQAARLGIPEWLSPDRVADHISELDTMLESATKIIAEPTFHLLFADREFLVLFQDLLANQISLIDASRYPTFFDRSGVLKRPTYTPAWLRKALFLRDKGRCQSCLADLTGTLALDPRIHVDHIRALAISGSNDPTNFQLYCEHCNLTKGARPHDHTFRTLTFW